MELGLKNKVILVTASSKGLGEAIAEKVASEGANLVLCSRSEARIQAVAAKLRERYGIAAVGVQADLGVPEDIEKYVQTALQHFGSIDGLVCNAGGPKSGSFLDISDEDWQQAVDRNLLSVIRLVRACFPAMKHKGGRIITIASSSVKVPIPGLVLSNTLRAGISGLMKTLSIEWGEHGILLNTVCPGRIATDRLLELDGNKAQAEHKTIEQVQQELSQEIPLGRYGQPSEFADFAAFLLSERNTYMTGSTFFVDGGLIKAL